MTLAVEEPQDSQLICRADGMPLYPTIVGPRCPLCGASSLTARPAA